MLSVALLGFQSLRAGIIFGLLFLDLASVIIPVVAEEGCCRALPYQNIYISQLNME